MSRDLTTALNDALVADRVQPVLLVEIETATGFVRVWNGIGDLSHDGDVYSGMGELGGISEVQESTDLGAFGLTLTLSGIPSALVSIALDDIRHNKPCSVWLGAFDLTTGTLIADPYLLFTGFTDVPTIEDTGSTSTITLTVENKLIDLERPRVRRYTPEDQAIDYPGDKGFDFVVGLQDAQIIWGR